jgi:hypothetical protein
VQFELSYPSNLVGRQVPNIEIGRTLPDGLLGWDAADESLRMFPVVMLLAIVPGGRAGLVSLQPSRDQVWSCVEPCASVGELASAGALTALHGWLDALGVGGSSTNAAANGVVAG